MKFIIGEQPHLTFNKALPDSHFFPSLKQEINPYPQYQPSTRSTRAHDFIEFSTVSFEIYSHDYPIDHNPAF